MALSVTLLAGAALLIASFIRLTQQNLGFQPHNLWVGAINLPIAQYPDQASRQRFVDRTLAALRDTPSVESVTVSGDIPLNGGNRTLYARADREVPPTERRATAPSHDIAPGYLQTWGIPLVAGRAFDEHDIAGGRNVCLISQTGAKKVFPNENPIGKTLLVTSNSTLWRLSESSATYGRNASLSCLKWSSICHWRRKIFHSLPSPFAAISNSMRSTMNFTPPSTGNDSDWVLVIDDAGTKFSQPGK